MRRGAWTTGGRTTSRRTSVPDGLSAFLSEWAPFAGVVVFVLGAIGSALAVIAKLVQSMLSALFTNRVLISRSTHQAEVSFYETQIKLCREAADTRIAELTHDLEAALRRCEKWEERFWSAAEAGRELQERVRRDTPPYGVRRPDTGAGS